MGPMLLSLLLTAHAADLGGVDPQRARDVRITSAAVGGAAGLALGIAVVRAPGILYDSGRPGPYLPVAVPVVLVQTASLSAASLGFSEWFLRHEYPWYVAVPVGMAAGLLVGAASGVLTWGTMGLLGSALDTLDCGSLDTVWSCTTMAMTVGAMWGGVAGVVPGAVLGPTVGWVVRF